MKIGRPVPESAVAAFAAEHSVPVRTPAQYEPLEAVH